MGLRDWLLGNRPDSSSLELVQRQIAEPPRFAVDIDDALLYGMYPAPTTTLSPRVNRREAMSVPAVKRSRDLIAGSLGSLPLTMIGPDREATEWSLFEQPEESIPRSITLTMTFEDLLFEQVAWWKVTHVGWHGKPVRVTRLDPRSVTVQQDQKVYETVQGNQGSVLQWIPDSQIIRFDGPNDPLLVAGARAIRSCMALDAAALRHADGSPPIDYFTPADGADPADDADIVDMLTAWQTARALRSTGYVPAALKYNVAGWDPEKLQLAEARQHAVLEIARCAGIDPEELGVSTTSRTYANQFDRRKAFLDFTLGGFRQAFEDRLSMNDVSPRGYTARLDLSDFLRSDDLTRQQVYTAGKANGSWTLDEIRDSERRPPLTAAERKESAPPPPPQIAQPTEEVQQDA